MKSRLEEERERLTSSEGFQAGYRVTLPPPARDGGTDCDECHGTGYRKRKPGAPVDDPDFGKLMPCECQAAEFAAQRQARLESLCNLKPHELALTLDDFAACRDGSTTDEIVRRVRQFAACPTGFFTVCGGPGNGKTLALIGLANHFRRQGRVAVYAPLAELIAWIQAGYGPGATVDAEARYQMVANAYFVAIDECDLDKVKHTEWVDQFETRFLDMRYRMALEGEAHTAFALNASPEETFPVWIVSRLRDARFAVERDTHGLGVPAIYENTGGDKRPGMPVPQGQLL